MRRPSLATGALSRGVERAVITRIAVTVMLSTFFIAAVAGVIDNHHAARAIIVFLV